MCPRADANYCIGICIYAYEGDTGSSAKEQNIMDEMHQNNVDDSAFLHVGAQYHGARVVGQLDPILSHLQSTIVVLPHLTLMNGENVLVHLVLQFTNVMSTHV